VFQLRSLLQLCVQESCVVCSWVCPSVTQVIITWYQRGVQTLQRIKLLSSLIYISLPIQWNCLHIDW